MNKEFIPYEQALALKELGFEEECLDFYDDNKELFYNHENKEKIHIGDSVKAPLYQQAFRWFREKYNMDIQIRGTHFRASYVIGIAKNINYNSADFSPLVIEWDYILDESGKSKTYEEAENACLIKLIEIVKQK